MLSSQAILQGILTDQSGTDIAAGSAMYTYFMRDLSGMIGGIVFAAVQVIHDRCLMLKQCKDLACFHNPRASSQLI